MMMSDHNAAANNHSNVVINLPVTPLHFPPRAEYFTGCGEQLTQLINDLQPHKVVTLCGVGGIGKTALAAEAVYTLVGEENKPPKNFPDGVVFYSFYGNPSVESAMEHIAFSCGVETKGLDPQQAVHKALNAKNVLIVLDGVENTDDFDQVIKVLSALSCGVLVTTRNKQDTKTNRQDMQPLEIEDAEALLAKWAAGQIDNKTIATEICEEIGRLPLAVQLVGQYLSETNDSTSNYFQWLKENTLEALESDKAEHCYQLIRILLTRSVAQLDDAGRQALPIFGCLAMKPVGLSVLAESLGLSHIESKKVMKSLINFGLVRLNNDHYEVAHALIHTYTREQIPLSKDVFLHLADWYENFIELESEKELNVYHILDSQQAHILSLIAQAHQRQLWQVGIVV